MPRKPKREQLVRKLSRRRALTRRMRDGARWLLPRAAAVLGLIGVIGGGWWYASGNMEQSWVGVQERGFAFMSLMSRQTGMVVKQVVVEGRDRMPADELTAAMGVSIGEPLVVLDLEEIRRRLEAQGWIESATVSRTFPSTVRVVLKERVPAALWQQGGALSLIDTQGKLIQSAHVEDFSYLPVVVGESAPEHAFRLIQMLSDTPDLFARVSSATRIGERRWTVRFYNGMEVLLPEQNTTEAWKRFKRLVEEEKLFERQVSRVDMRQEGRSYVRLAKEIVTKDKGHPPTAADDEI